MRTVLKCQGISCGFQFVLQGETSRNCSTGTGYESELFDKASFVEHYRALWSIIEYYRAIWEIQDSFHFLRPWFISRASRTCRKPPLSRSLPKSWSPAQCWWPCSGCFQRIWRCARETTWDDVRSWTAESWTQVLGITSRKGWAENSWEMT